MGNAVSCAPSIISNGVIKVLHFHGYMQIYTKPVKAAELMLENPGKFICDFRNLKVGQRIYGVLADEDLKRHKLYFVLPMEFLYSVLTHEEMASLTSSASKAFKNNNFSKIFPLLSEFCIFPSSDFKPFDHIASSSSSSSSSCSDVHQPKLVEKQRSWRPSLETIAETPCM